MAKPTSNAAARRATLEPESGSTAAPKHNKHQLLVPQTLAATELAQSPRPVIISVSVLQGIPVRYKNFHFCADLIKLFSREKLWEIRQRLPSKPVSKRRNLHTVRNFCFPMFVHCFVHRNHLPRRKGRYVFFYLHGIFHF